MCYFKPSTYFDLSSGVSLQTATGMVVLFVTAVRRQRLEASLALDHFGRGEYRSTILRAHHLSDHSAMPSC